MPERVTAKLLADPCQLAVFLHNIHHASHREAGSLVVEKHLLVTALPPHGKVASERLGRFLLKVDSALLVALAVYEHGALVQVNISKCKAHQFCHPDTSLEKQLQDRVVPGLAGGGIEKPQVFVHPQKYPL